MVKFLVGLAAVLGFLAAAEVYGAAYSAPAIVVTVAFSLGMAAQGVIGMLVTLRRWGRNI